MRPTTTLGMAFLLLVGGYVSGHGQQPANRPAGITVENTPAGQVLADTKSMTLYTFDRDSTPGKSACNGPCAQNWPPLMAAAGAKPVNGWSVVTRDDGSKQWAHNGKPLYTFSKDTKPGDTSGNGLNNVWHVAKP